MEKEKQAQELRASVNIEVEDDEELSAVGKGDPKNVGPMDQFCGTS